MQERKDGRRERVIKAREPPVPGTRCPPHTSERPAVGAPVGGSGEPGSGCHAAQSQKE